MVGGHLDHLIITNIGNGLFQAHSTRRGQAHRIILARGADIGQLLGLQRVHFQVRRLGILTDHHARVHLFAAADKQHAAFLKMPQGEGYRLPGLSRDDGAAMAAADLSLEGRITVIEPIHDAGSTGIGEEFTVIADQAA